MADKTDVANVMFNYCCFIMTPPKQEGVILLDACCLNFSRLMPPSQPLHSHLRREGLGSKGKRGREEMTPGWTN